jgi:hypothetical protein
MLISVCSDLHLEHGYQELPGGEVLILAGDIAELRSISKHYHSTKVIQDSPIEQFRCSEFFKYECAKYEKVFMVCGNHEHYHGRLDKTHNELKELLPKNVSLMENDLIEYKGIKFIGATLWTDLNKFDPITIEHLKIILNDYKIITNYYKDRGLYHKLVPEYTFSLHKKTLKFFKETIEKHSKDQFIVITHHGPSNLSIDEKYKYDVITNGGYVSDLSNFILDHENITHWVHGHMHDPVDYTIGKTRIISNPRGYYGREDTSKFNPNFTFEV